VSTIWLDGYQRGKPKSKTENRRFIWKIPTVETFQSVLWWKVLTSRLKEDFRLLLKAGWKYSKIAGRDNGYLVMCEVLNPDGTPHKIQTNRANFKDGRRPFGWIWAEYSSSKMVASVVFQLWLSCSSGSILLESVLRMSIARDLVGSTWSCFWPVRLEITGINAEVKCRPVEFSFWRKNPEKDAVMIFGIARYLLLRWAEKVWGWNWVFIQAIKATWNASGMHTNFRILEMKKW